VAARPTKLIAVVLGLLVLAASAPGRAGQRAEAPPARIVSVVPALTEVLFAIGAGERVVGVSSFDEFPAAVGDLPRVGALLDPNVERIFSLRPDLVVVYGSQTVLQDQFARAGIRTSPVRVTS